MSIRSLNILRIIGNLHLSQLPFRYANGKIKSYIFPKFSQQQLQSPHSPTSVALTPTTFQTRRSPSLANVSYTQLFRVGSGGKKK